MRNKMRSNKTLSNLWFCVFAGGVGFLIVIPLYWMIITALKTQTAIFTYPIEWFPKEFTLQNFVDLFARFPFGKVLRNSAIVSVSYSVISIVTCSMAAFAFAKIPFRGSEALLKVYLATLMIPFQSTLIPLFMLFNSAGLSNTYGSVIIPSLFRVFGIFLLVQHMRTIPDDYIDAARIDGASYFTILWKVILPLSLPIIAGYAVITFMDAWNDYLWPLVMLTKPEMMTVPVALGMVNGQFERNFGVQMAGSLISIVPVVLIYLAAQSKMKDGLTLGGIKG
ncbi:MAG TPA: carbohydrate ABC transporter permease [Clostridia bacterium]|nr:carbohydrate ABC transporter permease [Clostridia bacterium]